MARRRAGRDADRPWCYLRGGTLDAAARRSIAPVPSGSRYRVFMADTLDRPRRGLPPSVGLDDYLGAMRLVDRIYAAA